MGFFNHDDSNERNAYEQVHNEGKTSHELIAGAASFAAMRMYENKQQEEGKPQSWDFAKEMIAGIAGAEADKLIETKGLNAYDAARAKHQAQENAQQALAQSVQFGQDARYERREYSGEEYQRGPSGGGGQYGGGGYSDGQYGGGGGGGGGYGQGGPGYGGSGQFEGERHHQHHEGREERRDERDYGRGEEQRY